MSFPKFYVTYCVMDMDAGANPFGHSFLIFSKQESAQASIEAVDALGYYSQPSTTTNPIIKNLKKFLGFHIDLQDGHGVLKQEKMREIDGNGLKGISFALSQERFDTVLTSYQNSMKQEEEAIKELNAELIAKGIEPNGYNRHIAEKEKADAEKRKPRLKPFHVTMKLTPNGFDSTDSYTCKDHSLSLLSEHGVISDDVKSQIICSRAQQTFPRFSALDFAPIRLISTGEPVEQLSKKGKIFYNHVWGANHLYWATPVVTLDNPLSTKQKEDLNEHYLLIKNLMARIVKQQELLRERIAEVRAQAGTQEFIGHLNIQLQRVQNLELLFSKAQNNQRATLFNTQLATADKVLNVANMAMDPERVNYSFMLRAYNSLAAQNALIGLLAILISAALIVIAPPLGIALTAVTTLATARHAYGFYTEEVEFAKARKDYREYIAQPLVDEMEIDSSQSLSC